VAALPLPLQDFHLLAFASFAGRTHQGNALNMYRLWRHIQEYNTSLKWIL